MSQSLLLIPASVVAQAQQAAAKAPAQAWTKKTPDGQPDLQGYLVHIDGCVPLERNVNCGTKEFYTAAELGLPAAQRCPPPGTAAAAAPAAVEAAQVVVQPQPLEAGGAAGGRGGAGRGAAAPAGQATAADVHYDLAQFSLSGGPAAENNRTSLIIGPEGRIPPLSAIGQKRQADLAAATRTNFDSAENRPLAERCIVWGASRTAPDVCRLQQQRPDPSGRGMGDDHAGNDAGRPNHSTGCEPPPLAENVRTWVGDSRGHWEGDTLVIETTNFNGRNPFQRVGSDKMH